MQPRELAFAPVGRRHRLLMEALKLGETAFASVLFVYSIQDYKMHANKKKAIFIYERFLRDVLNPSSGFGFDFGGFDPSAPYDLELVVNYEFSETTKQKIKSGIDQASTNLDKAKRKNFLKRWATSKGRKADPNLYNEAFREFIQPGTQSGLSDVASKLDQQREAPDFYAKLTAAVPRLQKQMEECNFDVTRVGIEDTAGIVLANLESAGLI